MAKTYFNEDEKDKYSQEDLEKEKKHYLLNIKLGDNYRI